MRGRRQSFVIKGYRGGLSRNAFDNEALSTAMRLMVAH